MDFLNSLFIWVFHIFSLNKEGGLNSLEQSALRSITTRPGHISLSLSLSSCFSCAHSNFNSAPKHKLDTLSLPINNILLSAFDCRAKMWTLQRSGSSSGAASNSNQLHRELMAGKSFTIQRFSHHTAHRDNYRYLKK